MTRARRTSSVRAFLLLESVTGILLIGVVLGATAYLTIQFGRSADHAVNQRRAMLAAEARIEALRAGVLPLADATFSSQEEDMRYEIRLLAGEPQWSPLQLVECRAATTGRDGREVAFTLRAYVQPAQEGDASP